MTYPAIKLNLGAGLSFGQDVIGQGTLTQSVKPVTSNYNKPIDENLFLDTWAVLFPEKPLESMVQSFDTYSQENQNIQSIPSGTYTGQPIVSTEQYQTAEKDIDSFYNTLKNTGKTPETINLLRTLFPTINDQQVDAILQPEKNMDFSEIATGVPSFETYRKSYYAAKGWQDYGDPSSWNYGTNPAFGMQPGMTEESPELIADMQHTSEAEETYEKLYGKGAYKRSGQAQAIESFLPTVSKLMNPARPKINWYDPFTDITTIGSLGTAGGLGGVGLILLTAVSAAVMGTVNTTQSVKNTVQNWNQLDTGGKVKSIGADVLNAGFTVLAGYGVKITATQAYQEVMGASLRRNFQSYAKSIGFPVTQQEEDNFVNFAMKNIPETTKIKMALKTVFNPATEPSTGALKLAAGENPVKPNIIWNISEEGAQEADVIAQDMTTNYAGKFIPQGTYTGAMAYGGEAFKPTDAVPFNTAGKGFSPESAAIVPFTVEQYATKMGIGISQASQELTQKAITGEVESLGGQTYKAVTQPSMQPSTSVQTGTKVYPKTITDNISAGITTKSGMAARLATFTDQTYNQLIKKTMAELNTIWDTEYPKVRTMAQDNIAEAQRQSHGILPESTVPTQTGQTPTTMSLEQYRTFIDTPQGQTEWDKIRNWNNEQSKLGRTDKLGQKAVDVYYDEVLKGNTQPSTMPVQPSVPVNPTIETPAGTVPPTESPVAPPVESVPSSESGTTPPAEPPVVPPYQPEPSPVNPSPLSENVIGLRPIQPGLTRQETYNNWIDLQVNKLTSKVGAHEPVLKDALTNPAMNERARVKPIIDSQAEILGDKATKLVNDTFKLDKKGRITSLANVIPSIGAPTIQDVAARLPVYQSSLNAQQLKTLNTIKEAIQPYHDLMIEQGIEIRHRGDVMKGGFYIPRSSANLEDVDMPYKVSGGGKGGKPGFMKPAVFDSMAEGITKGFEYPSIGEALSNYVKGAGQKATDTFVTNYFKTLTDDTGNLLGETVKMRMLRQNPEIVKVVEEIKHNLGLLKNNIGALSQRQMDVIDLWGNDPNYDDIDELINSLHEMKGGSAKLTKPELQTLYDENLKTLHDLRPEYKRALEIAKVTPRDQGVINLPGLQGRTFPLEMANAANIILKSEGALTGTGHEVSALINAFNGMWAMVHATGDASFSFIQGLVSLYDNPVSWGKAMNLMVRTLFDGKVAGSFLKDFDNFAIKNGLPTASEWAKAGSEYGGASGFMESAGISDKISSVPIVKQTNRAFSVAGDTLRLIRNQDELLHQMNKGRTLAEIKSSGDMARIAGINNVMTGWSAKGVGGSIGRTVLFAPRWFQARLETVVNAAEGIRPNAPINQRIARNAILKMVAFGVLLTVAANAAQGQETDFRPVVDGKRNPQFMRILYGGNWYSIFGPFDSLLGMLINIGTGNGLNALRSMGSGLISISSDLWSGRDYNWNPVGTKPFNAKQLIQWTLRQVVPFSISQLPSGVKQIGQGQIVPGGVQVVSQIAGVKSYPDTDWATIISQLGLQQNPNALLYSTETQIYDTGNLYTDILSKLGSINPSEVIGKSIYPPIVQSIAQAKEDLDLLNQERSRTLISLETNPTDTNGEKQDTYKEFYNQWNHYQNLLSAGKNAEYTDKNGVKHSGTDAVTAFTGDYLNYKLGDMTPAEFVTLNQYNNLSGADKDKFLNAHPELSANTRDETLIDNPEENALLAIYGKAKIMTPDAYTKALQMVKDLGIPDSAVEKFLPTEKEARFLKWYKEDIAYDALATTKDKDTYLKNNPEYRDDRYRRTAYGNNATDYFAELYVEYANATSTAAKHQIRAEDAGFDKWITTAYPTLAPIVPTQKSQTTTPVTPVKPMTPEEYKKATGQ